MATDHWRDEKGRYAGPLKIKTAYPPTPYGDDDCCNGCGAHYLVAHASDCQAGEGGAAR